MEPSRTPPASASLAVLPFDGRPEQPRPIQFILSEIECGGAKVRALTRVFAPGQSRLCQLCPVGQCGADHELGVCQVMTAREVTHESAPLFVSRPGDTRPSDHVARSG